MSKPRDITDEVLAAPDGTVVRSVPVGSVWVIGPDEAIPALRRMTCVWSRHPDQIGATHTTADLELLRVRTDQFEIVGAVPGTPAAATDVEVRADGVDLAQLPAELADALSTLLRSGCRHGLRVSVAQRIETRPDGTRAPRRDELPSERGVRVTDAAEVRRAAERAHGSRALAHLAASGDLNDPLTNHVMARLDPGRIDEDKARELLAAYGDEPGPDLEPEQ